MACAFVYEPITSLRLVVSFPLSLGFHICLEESRDSVVALYMELGPEARLKQEEIIGKKVVLASTFEQDSRLKTGHEYEKSVFLNLFKDQPEALKQAKYYTVRYKCLRTNKIIVEQRTKVYEQAQGVWRFEEKTGSEVRTDQVIDDGRLILEDGQQDTVFHDVTQASFNSSRLSGSLTIDDFEDR